MQEVERLCDSVVVVAHGRTVATGTVPELLAETDDALPAQIVAALATSLLAVLVMRVRREVDDHPQPRPAADRLS